MGPSLRPHLSRFQALTPHSLRLWTLDFGGRLGINQRVIPEMMHILDERFDPLAVVSLTPVGLWQPARGAGAAVESCGTEGSREATLGMCLVRDFGRLLEMVWHR